MSASLHVYRQKEAEEKNAAIEAMVEGAIAEGKIDSTAKEHWTQMAQANLELVKNTLESIPAREQITKEIAKDPENIKAAAEGSTTAEKKLAERINAVVGNDFEFKSLK